MNGFVAMGFIPIESQGDAACGALMGTIYPEKCSSTTNGHESTRIKTRIGGLLAPFAMRDINGESFSPGHLMCLPSVIRVDLCPFVVSRLNGSGLERLVELTAKIAKNAEIWEKQGISL
jgi:hypothetical protein